MKIEGDEEYLAWSVLLIRPHVSGDEANLQAPDPYIMNYAWFIVVV